MKALPDANPVESSLRIVLRVHDPLRRAILDEILRAGGHRRVEGPCDVFLMEGDLEVDDKDYIRTVALGGQISEAAANLPQDASAAQIDAALRAVACGLMVRSRDLGFDPVDAVVETNHDGLLTPRETEVLQAIADGLGNKAIARRLSISQHTVKYHVESVFRKMGVRSRTEALSKAWRDVRGIIDL